MSVLPFDMSGITRDANGRAHYVDRPPSLMHMLRTTVGKIVKPVLRESTPWQRITQR